MGKYIAIVEDEEDIASLISLHLQKSNFDTREFSDAAIFFREIGISPPELVILDLMLPDADGFEICKRLKTSNEYAKLPVIMLTAKGEESDKILGLELGADDYVVKPFSPKELVARVKAVLRRANPFEKTGSISVGDGIEIDPDKFQVKVNGSLVDLTATEFKILALLARRAGYVYSREQILDHLWGRDKAVIDRTVDVHVKHLRGKLGDASKIIKNVRGIGYKLEE